MSLKTVDLASTVAYLEVVEKIDPTYGLRTTTNGDNVMKNLIVRLSVLALAATGFSASTIATTTSKSYEIRKTTAATVASAPLCPPNGSQGYCGLR